MTLRSLFPGYLKGFDDCFNECFAWMYQLNILALQWCTTHPDVNLCPFLRCIDCIETIYGKTKGFGGDEHLCHHSSPGGQMCLDHQATTLKILVHAEASLGAYLWREMFWKRPVKGYNFCIPKLVRFWARWFLGLNLLRPKDPCMLGRVHDHDTSPEGFETFNSEWIRGM